MSAAEWVTWLSLAGSVVAVFVGVLYRRRARKALAEIQGLRAADPGEVRRAHP